MSSQGESSDSGPDSEEVAGAVAEISQSDPPEHCDEENCSHKSSIWNFEGTLTMDLPPDDWNDGEMPAQDDMFLHFRTDHFKNPPIPITCMHIALDFSKANRGGIFGRTFTAPLSGMVQARPASRDTWLSWLQFGSGAVIEEMSPYREDQVLEVLDVLRRRVNLEGWKVVAKCGRRNRYEIRGRAWKFSGTLVALISPDNDNYIDSARNAFETTGGLLKLPKVLRYMTVLADLRSPISGASGLVSIPIKGYIQCGDKCDHAAWKKWQPNFLFDVVHMGLASHAEFLADMDMARLQDGSSYWFEIYQTGKLRLNPAGRLSMALQASSLLPLRGCAPEQRACRTAPRAQHPPAAPPRLPHHHLPGRGGGRGRRLRRVLRHVASALMARCPRAAPLARRFTNALLHQRVAPPARRSIRPRTARLSARAPLGQRAARPAHRSARAQLQLRDTSRSPRAEPSLRRSARALPGPRAARPARRSNCATLRGLGARAHPSRAPLPGRPRAAQPACRPAQAVRSPRWKLAIRPSSSTPRLDCPDARRRLIRRRYPRIQRTKEGGGGAPNPLPPPPRGAHRQGCQHTYFQVVGLFSHSDWLRQGAAASVPSSSSSGHAARDKKRKDGGSVASPSSRAGKTPNRNPMGGIHSGVNSLGVQTPATLLRGNPATTPPATALSNPTAEQASCCANILLFMCSLIPSLMYSRGDALNYPLHCHSKASQLPLLDRPGLAWPRLPSLLLPFNTVSRLPQTKIPVPLALFLVVKAVRCSALLVGLAT